MRDAVDDQAALAGCHDDERVVGRGVAIDRDPVKRHVGDFDGHLAQQRLGDAGIRGEIAKHRGHIGADHPSALADAGDCDLLARQARSLRMDLGQRVGRHDSVRGAHPVAGGQVGDRARKPGDETIDGERLEDDARRERQDLSRIDLQQGGERIARLAGGLHARFASTGVCVSGVDHQRADRLAACEVLLAHRDGGGAKAVAREYAGHCGARRQPEDGQIPAIRLADSGLGDADFDAVDREDRIVGGNMQVDRHDVVSRIGMVGKTHIIACLRHTVLRGAGARRGRRGNAPRRWRRACQRRCASPASA